MFSIESLAHLNDKPTPFYFYDLKILHNTLKDLLNASEPFKYHIHYALKANCNDEILNRIKNYGIGADCVSGNEVKKALEIGFDSNKIVFAGVGKTDKEINFAIDNDLYSINCESFEEIQVIDNLAGIKEKCVSIAIRINPNINANTHHHITTGLKGNKFGISINQVPKLIDYVKKLKNIKLDGIHFHIGSQITDLLPFKNLCETVNQIVQQLKNDGINLKNLNLGG